MGGVRGDQKPQNRIEIFQNTETAGTNVQDDVISLQVMYSTTLYVDVNQTYDHHIHNILQYYN